MREPKPALTKPKCITVKLTLDNRHLVTKWPVTMPEIITSAHTVKTTNTLFCTLSVGRERDI